MDLLPLDDERIRGVSSSNDGTPETNQRASLQSSPDNNTNEPQIGVRRVQSLHTSSNSSPNPRDIRAPNSATPHFTFSKPSIDMLDENEGRR